MGSIKPALSGRVKAARLDNPHAEQASRKGAGGLPPCRPGRSVPVPPDPYERLQAARTAVKALKDERSMLAVRLVDLAKASDEEALVEASMRLDALPTELLRAELKLARADRQAARATLQAAEASLARALANVRDVEPLPDATVKEKLERAAGSGDEDAPEDEQADGDEQAPAETPGLVDAAKQRRGADEQWVRECRLAVDGPSSGSGRWRRASPRRAGPSPTSRPTGPSPSGPPRPEARSSRPGRPTARPSST